MPGCNIGSKTLLVGRRKLPLKFTCPDSTSTCPSTLLNRVELHCEDSAKKITCQAGQIGVLFHLPDCHILPNSLATCNGASGYVACWIPFIPRKNMGKVLGQRSVSFSILQQSARQVNTYITCPPDLQRTNYLTSNLPLLN